MKLQTCKPASLHDTSRAAGFCQSPVPVHAQSILVVDDEEDIRHLISSVLASDGFDVNATADGEEAWEALQHEHYDLLVTDNEMPRLTGIKLIKRIRDAGMSLPVIVASGFLSTEGVRDYAQLQIAAVIPKPFNIGEFLTTVRTALRVSGEDATADHGTFANAPLPLSTSQPQASKPAHNHVLIVDDDAVVRGSLASVLESEGYVVDEARNGIEAVTRAIEHTPDLVLLDLNMPYWDGWTAFAKLDRVRPLVPVIVITARPQQYKEAVRLGVDAFMEKPLNIPILVRAVKRFTTEDENRHVRRITNPAFVTRLLDTNYS
jgi:DNA-binding response OmpR family regulator